MLPAARTASRTAPATTIAAAASRASSGSAGRDPVATANAVSPSTVVAAGAVERRCRRGQRPPAGARRACRAWRPSPQRRGSSTRRTGPAAGPDSAKARCRPGPSRRSPASGAPSSPMTSPNALTAAHACDRGAVGQDAPALPSPPRIQPAGRRACRPCSPCPRRRYRATDRAASAGSSARRRRRRPARSAAPRTRSKTTAAGDDRHRAARRRQPDPARRQAVLHARGRAEAEGAAAGQQDRVGPPVQVPGPSSAVSRVPGPPPRTSAPTAPAGGRRTVQPVGPRGVQWPSRADPPRAAGARPRWQRGQVRAAPADDRAQIVVPHSGTARRPGRRPEALLHRARSRRSGVRKSLMSSPAPRSPPRAPRARPRRRARAPAAAASPAGASGCTRAQVQRLVGVDVADAGDDRLVEQRGLHRRPPASRTRGPGRRTSKPSPSGSGPRRSAR